MQECDVVLQASRIGVPHEPVESFEKFWHAMPRRIEYAAAEIKLRAVVAKTPEGSESPSLRGGFIRLTDDQVEIGFSIYRFS